MTRLVIYLLGVLAVATGLAWLADRPGSLVIAWEGYEIETSVFRAVVILAVVTGLALFLWSLMRQLWESPAMLGNYLARRRQRRGLDALSSGMIAIGAGDRSSATRYAIQARRSLPNEPLTHLLRAQAAQLSGDKATARRIFEAMLGSPDTEQLGLRGLFLEASREGEGEAARQFAERALGLNPRLGWPVEALFDLQCKSGDWSGALETLNTARKNGHYAKGETDRRRAVLLTAKAQALEDHHADKALTLALEAHGLAPDLIPAAAIAGRLLAARGNTARAAKIIQKTWSRAPHPDLATAYAHARIGDSPRDRFDRVKQLALLNPMSIESSLALATAALEAREFDEARRALAPLADGRLTRRAATLMARIESEDKADRGRVREWLARAVTAQRDAAWTADGVVSDRWAPVSPVTGQLDAFQWRVPVEELAPDAGDLLAERLGALVMVDEPAGTGVSVVERAVPPDAAPAPQRQKKGRTQTPASPADDGEKPRKDVIAGPAAVTVTVPEHTRLDVSPAREEAGVEIIDAEVVAEAEPSIAAGAVSTGAPAQSRQPAAVERPAAEVKQGTQQPGRSALPGPLESATAAPVATPAAAAASRKAGRPARQAEAKVFVPPRAPDDPGTENVDEEEVTTSLERTYRASR